MTSQVLAYFPSPPQGVWHVGPLALRAYALCIIVGIIVAIVWGDRRWVRRGGEKGTVVDIAIWAVPFGFVGGRAYHVATDWQKYFGEGRDPLDALKVWQGGLGIWGAVLFGALGAWIGCRRRGIPLPAFADAVAPPVLLAQAIGRVGNYFNQELYGRPTDVPWGLEIYVREPDQLNGVALDPRVLVESAYPAVHPTFLYELLWNVMIVLVLVVIDRRRQIGHGRLFAMYVAGYCAGRFWIELMRSDPANEVAGIRINVFTAVIAFAAAVVYIALARKGREDPAALQPRVKGGAVAEADVPGTEEPELVEAASVEPDEGADGRLDLGKKG